MQSAQVLRAELRASGAGGSVVGVGKREPFQ